LSTHKPFFFALYVGHTTHSRSKEIIFKITPLFAVKGDQRHFHLSHYIKTSFPFQCCFDQAMIPQTDQSQGLKRSGISKDLALVALIIAFAGNTDAFRPLSLRTINPSTKIVSGRPQLPTLGLRQQESKPRFLFGLRAAATEPISREKMYQLAQVDQTHRSFAHVQKIDFFVSQENFKTWNEALKARDYEKATSLYSTSDLTFLPTVSPEFIRDVPSTKRYFMDFIQRLPEGKITSDSVQCLSADAYLHTGMYTFMTGPQDSRTPVSARFSYLWKRISGQWKIIHHHSSVVPGSSKIVDLYPVAQVCDIHTFFHHFQC
jgi:hypothetical protein